MADTTIYPYGTNGQLPSSIGVINDLTTGGADKALSAEMGKEIGEKMVFLEDTDKVSVAKTLDDAFMSKILNEDDYTKTTGYYINKDNGNPVSSSGHAYIKIDAENFRGSKLYMTGINNDIGYALGWSSFNSEGTRIGGGYYGWVSSWTLTIDSSVAYYLLSIGKSPDNFKAAWDLNYIPVATGDYDIVSVNGGKKFVVSDLSWLSHIDSIKLKSGLFETLNKIDLSHIVSGYTLAVTQNNATIQQDASSSILMQEIPDGVSSISVYGLNNATFSYAIYTGFAIVDETMAVLSSSRWYGTTLAWRTLSVPSASGKKYLVMTASSSSELGYDINDVKILFDPVDLGRDSQWYIDHTNDVNLKLNVSYEAFPSNIITDPNTEVSRSENFYTFTFPVNGEKYLFWYFPSGSITNTADTFVQYDSNDDVLLSENNYGVGNTTNFGVYGFKKQNCAIVKLQSGCAKCKVQMWLGPTGNGTVSLRQIIAAGNKMFLTNDRIIYWRKPRVTSIDGIVLNQYNKRPLEGLTICCLGDSITDFGNGGITDGYGYPKYIQSNFDCCCINYGRGNARFIDVASTNPTKDTDPGTPGSGVSGNENNKLSVQVRWMLREMSEESITPDVVVISGGTNDCFSDVNYGTLADAMANYGNTTDAVKTTFYDAAVYMVSKIRAAYPNVKIFFGTPINSLMRGGQGQHDRLPAWRDAMISAAKAMGCGVIDWYSESGIVDYPAGVWNESTNQINHNNPFFNTNDGIHPSKLGVDLMAKLAVNEIAKAFPT